MTFGNSTRVQAPAYSPVTRSDQDELAVLKPSGGASGDDGHNLEPAPYQNTKKRVLLGPRRYTWIGTLNVRTLKRSKLELADRFIANRLDILGIQEHRIVHTETTKTETFCGGAKLITSSAWRNGCGASVGGVGVMVSKDAYDSVTSVTPYGSRILKVCLDGNPRVTVVVVYSPTETSSADEAEEFHNNLRDVERSTPAHDVLLILGDLNAKLGPEVPGFSFNTRTNRNGQLLLDTLQECNLEATNLRFMRKREKRWTFLSEGTNHKALLDYVLIRRKWRNSVKDTRVTNSFASVGSDHRAVISRVRLSLRKKKQQPRRVFYDMEPLQRDEDLREEYAVTVQNRFAALSEESQTATEKYGAFSEAVTLACKEHLEVKKKEKKTNIAKDARVQTARAKVIAAKETFRREQTDRTREDVNKAKDELGEAYTAAEEREIERMVRKVEETAEQGRHRASWNLVNELTGRCRGAGSRISGESAEARLESWRSHFSGLLGRPPDVPDPDLVIQKIVEGKLPIYDGPFTQEELNAARKQLKSGKASGEDGISPEIIKYVDTGDIVLEMCNDALLNRRIPDQWKRLNIVPVPKKGDLTKTQNYRGIALSSVVAKTLNRMIRNRMTPAFEEILRPSVKLFQKALNPKFFLQKRHYFCGEFLR